MKIQAINNINFGNKYNFKPEEFTQLLDKVTKSGSYSEHGDEFISRNLRTLNINKEAVFADNRYGFSPKHPVEGTSTLRFGDVKLTFSNKTSEVVKCENPYKVAWNSIKENAVKYLKMANENFNNPNVVEKTYAGMRGLTKAALRGYHKPKI